MKTYKSILIFTIAVLSIVSCKKENQPGAEFVPPPGFSTYSTSVAAITGEVARALEKVYEDNGALREVNAAILCGYYDDERVLLKDLLQPESSGLYQCGEFHRFNPDTGRFKRRFIEVVQGGDFPTLNAELAILLARKRTGGAIMQSALLDSTPSILSGAYPVSIYFPYSENFGNVQIYDTLPVNSKLAIVLKPTLVYTDREDDSAPGRKPYYCSGALNNLCYTTVTVNDGYAEFNPTHIVTIGATVKTTPSEVLKTDLVTRTYNGWSRLTRQMDKLISFSGNGGGSEIKICRVNGYLRLSDDQITDFAGDVTTVHFTRADIRKKRFKRIYSVWDPNWNYQDIEQIYAVYEDDTHGTKTISGSLTTTLNLPGKLGKVEGEIGFKIGIATQDEIVVQRKIDRKSYLRDGLNNQGWGNYPDQNDFLAAGIDWPLFDGGAIWTYTMPYRIY